jgi:hypothetical protein
MKATLFNGFDVIGADTSLSLQRRLFRDHRPFVIPLVYGQYHASFPPERTAAIVVFVADINASLVVR